MTETALTELWPKLKELSRIEKLRVMHFLVIELAGDEDLALLEDGALTQFGHPMRRLMRRTP